MILRVHKEITYDQIRSKSEVESLPCVDQAQEHGIIVDSNAQKFGGLKWMLINQKGERYIIPFLLEEGIIILPYNEHTDENLKVLSIVDISDPDGKWEHSKL